MSTPFSSAADVRSDLQLLYVERALAEANGLTSNATYMADLEDDIASHRSAYIGAAVTEIASLRAALSGRLEG